MSTVTSGILRGALVEVKRQLDTKAGITALSAMTERIDEINESLDAKLNIADMQPMSMEESDVLFNDVFGAYEFTKS